MKLQAFAKTDVGKKRDNNEDAFLVDHDLGLYAVADGMGGHAAGEVASKLALTTLLKELQSWRGVLQDYRPDGPVEVRDVVINLVEECVQRACQAVFTAADQAPDKRGMGTTLTGILIRDTDAFVGHVGDSRVYLVREGAVHQLTEDHTLVNELIKRGRIGRSGARMLDLDNIITRAVGHQERVQVDTLHLSLLPGDRLILCSDGLHGYFRPGDIESTLQAGSLEEAPGRFIDLANAAGGKDNITVILVEVPGDETVRAGELRRNLEVLREAPLLAYLEYRELVALMNAAYIRTVQEGEFIVQAGQSSDELFILLQGQARALADEKEVHRLKVGAHAGELAIFSGLPSQVSIQVIQPGQLMVIGREQFSAFIRREKNAGMKLLWRLVQLLAAERAPERNGKRRYVESMTPEWMVPEDRRGQGE
jgi:serine/threonine protein phosphatase PrpC